MVSFTKTLPTCILFTDDKISLSQIDNFDYRTKLQKDEHLVLLTIDPNFIDRKW